MYLHVRANHRSLQKQSSQSFFGVYALTTVSKEASHRAEEATSCQGKMI